MSKCAQLTSPSPPGDTVRVITVPATQASLERFPDLGFSRFGVFFPVRNILPLTLPRLVHPEFLCLWRPECPFSKRPSLIVISQGHCASPMPGPWHLYPVSFSRITVKFLMTRLQCATIFKFQFKITGIFYLSPGQLMLHESRDWLFFH